MPFSDAVAVASLYLALVGLLSTFFYIQLGQWLNGILGTDSKWHQVKGRTPESNYFDKRLECYFEAVQAYSPWTFLGWAAVTSFLIIVGLFLHILQSGLPPADAVFLSFYVSTPGYFFLGIYLLLSVVMLVIGYRKAKQLRDDVKDNL